MKALNLTPDPSPKERRENSSPSFGGKKRGLKL
jgi:hypothetical protein